MLTFLRNMVGVKADQAVQKGLEALVRWDPKAATEAELRTMEQHLDALGLQVAEARQSFEREKKEADAIEALSHQRMAAAEQIEKQLAAETDPTRQAALNKSLETLVGLLEKMAPEIEREARDVVDAKGFLEMLEQTYADAGAKLKQARAELDRARRDMERASQQRAAAERQAEAARQAAGLASTTSGLSVALKAMRENAEKDLANAEAASSKARMLKPTVPEQEDPNIAKAMAAAAGGAPAPSSLGDRLAALRAKSR